MWESIIAEFTKNPRDVKTVPIIPREPKWFYVLVEADNLYVESGRTHFNHSQISDRRNLQRVEFKTMLDLYHRRKRGEAVAAEAKQRTQNQVYWYGILAEMNL